MLNFGDITNNSFDMTTYNNSSQIIANFNKSNTFINIFKCIEKLLRRKMQLNISNVIAKRINKIK